jgi:Gpi18-like mannosyltransferase
MRSMGFWWQLASTSIIYKFLSTNITWVIISGIGYIIYKLVFGDMLSAMFATILKALTKPKWPSGSGGWGWDKWGWGGGWDKKK